MKATAASKSKKKINFNKFGYYAISLVVVAVLGLWPTYFSKFFDGTADFNFYYHFHFMLAASWIVQLPIT